MKKKSKKRIIVLSVTILVLLIITVIAYMQINITGKATGISLGSPKKVGLTSSQSITIGGDITKKLCAASYTTEVAAVATDLANKVNGGVEGLIKDALKIPSAELPDVYGILASIANYLQQNPNTQCLRKIGVAACGKDWKGTLYVNFDMTRQKSYLYPDWEYYNEKLRYVGQEIDCTAELGCAFSYNPKTKDISPSCFGQ